MKTIRWLALAGLVVVLSGCGRGGEGADSVHQAGSPAPGDAAAPRGPLQPDPGGRIIEVEMLTDLENGGANVFRPAEFETSKGDVIRYKLVSGVHNVHFQADSNKTMGSAPAASPMLQAPGQTTDVKVTWSPGEYFFQCDPHALLGMVGRVTVK